MTDIVDKLNEMIATEFDGSPRTPVWRAAVLELQAASSQKGEIATLQQALAEKDAEIEHLQSAAGAVSKGATFGEIKAKSQPVDPAANEHSA
jgi:hypothetical protein